MKNSVVINFVIYEAIFNVVIKRGRGDFISPDNKEDTSCWVHQDQNWFYAFGSFYEIIDVLRITV